MQRRKPPEKDEVEIEVAPDAPVISTGSTLLDLAISGKRLERGGLPGGILVEIFGPSATGKTVLLSEIAGGIQRKGGEVRFYDPEGRLNKQFASLFGLDVDSLSDYGTPDTVAEVFRPIRDWEPADDKHIHGIFADSLAALTTEWAEEGKDNFGMRRAKEFSEELRSMCRVLPKRNILMVCSNQVRVNVNAGPYEAKYKTPGGEAIGFYSSVRLRTKLSGKIKRKRKIKGKDHEVVKGVEIEVDVFKNSVDAPYRKAPVHIVFDYGVDDVRANLQWLKTNMGDSQYGVGDLSLSKSLDTAAAMVEEQKLERKLKEEVTGLWREIDSAFATNRSKHRDE